MEKFDELNDLLTLKVIAETLNKSNDLKTVLQQVLEALLEVTGLQTGWLFLVGERPEYIFAADYGLPPALTWGNKRPMCEGSCYCLNKLWEGELDQPVNIINCKRLGDAKRLNWGDTAGITHHATVPLTSGGDVFGLLNVASPGKDQFSDKELNLLQAVALQISTAIKRTRLYELQECRVDFLSKMDDMLRTINRVGSLDELPAKVTEVVCQTFGWEAAAIYIKREFIYSLEGKCGELSSSYFPTLFYEQDLTQLKDRINWNPQLPESIRISLRAKNEATAVLPLIAGELPIGFLIVKGILDPFKKIVHQEVLRALASHVALAFENLKLNEKQREIERLEERNRLARDLHDAVNQKLFSLSLTANGAAVLAPKDDLSLQEALSDIKHLSQEALKEMRALIWQLRPIGLEDGLIEAVKRYGKGIGLEVTFEVSSFIDLPKPFEDHLYRVCQEGLNNIRKHAKVHNAKIQIWVKETNLYLVIKDEGVGFLSMGSTPRDSLGLTSMMERAKLLGGSLSIDSDLNKGTALRFVLPIPQMGK